MRNEIVEGIFKTKHEILGGETFQVLNLIINYSNVF